MLLPHLLQRLQLIHLTTQIVWLEDSTRQPKLVQTVTQRNKQLSTAVQVKVTMLKQQGARHATIPMEIISFLTYQHSMVSNLILHVELQAVVTHQLLLLTRSTHGKQSHYLQERYVLNSLEQMELHLINTHLRLKRPQQLQMHHSGAPLMSLVLLHIL